MISWFQTFDFKCNLYRYAKTAGVATMDAGHGGEGDESGDDDADADMNGEDGAGGDDDDDDGGMEPEDLGAAGATEAALARSTRGTRWGAVYKLQSSLPIIA